MGVTMRNSMAKTIKNLNSDFSNFRWVLERCVQVCTACILKRFFFLQKLRFYIAIKRRFRERN